MAWRSTTSPSRRTAAVPHGVDQRRRDPGGQQRNDRRQRSRSRSRRRRTTASRSTSRPPTAPAPPPPRPASGDYVPAARSAITIPAGQTTYTFAVSDQRRHARRARRDVRRQALERERRHARATGRASARSSTTTSRRRSSTDVVISQVYGGGGNAGATLTNDFVELFNRGTTSVEPDGWSVQYTRRRRQPAPGS